MSAGDEIIMPFGSWGGIAALLGAGGLGGVLTALLQRPSKRTVDAAAAKDEATGEAAVIASIASAFTGTTGALREEIERMQVMLDDMRRRVVEAEAMAAAQAQVIVDQKAQLEVSHADVVRLRGERDTALARVAQLEGENRQLKAIADAAKRLEGKT